MNNNRRKRIRKVYNSLLELRSELESVRDEEQDAFDNMPESLQDSTQGELNQSAIDNLESVISDLESLDDVLEEAMQ